MTEIKPYLRLLIDLGDKVPHGGSNSYFTMSQIASIYNFPAPTPNKYTVGVISFGGGLYGTVSSTGVLTNGDCQKYWSYIGIPVVNQPTVIVVPIHGAKNIPNIHDGGATMENTLDVQTIGGACPSSNLTIILYIAPQTESFCSAFSYIYNNSNRPIVVSCSWGMPEIYMSANDLAQTNTLFGEKKKVFCFLF